MAKHSKTGLRWGRIFAVSFAFITIVAALSSGVVFLASRGNEPEAEPVAIFSATPSDGATAEPSLVPTPAPTPTPPPTPTPEPEPLGKVSVRIRAVGDLMNHDENLSAAMRDGVYDFSPFFTAIAPSLAAADLTIGNLETTIGAPPYEGYPTFRSPESYLDALTDAGFDVLTLANNHILDKGWKGVQATIDALEKREISYAGAYSDEGKSKEILLCDVNGVKVAVLAYAEYTNSNIDVQYAVHYLKGNTFAADVKAAREQGADVVLAMVHWGNEYELKESESQRVWAGKLADAGVDIVLGSHPHVVQPAAWLETEAEDGSTRRTFVAYSMGNFISNQRTLPRDAGVIFDFEIEKDLDTGLCQILEASYVPTWVLKGLEDGKPTYDVLPAGKYREADYPQLTGSRRTRIVNVWQEITERLAGSGATALKE